MTRNNYECHKEREISDTAIGLATVRNDIKWTKESIKDISEKLDVLISGFNNLNTQLNRMSKDIYGNGTVGLKTKVANHQEYISEQKGSLKTLYLVFGTVQTLVISAVVWVIRNMK